LQNGGYEHALYSKVLSFIGFKKVNREAQEAVKEYLHSEKFDKDAFLTSIKEESSPMELSAKLHLL